MTLLENIIGLLEALLHGNTGSFALGHEDRGVKRCIAIVREELTKPLNPADQDQLGRALYYTSPLRINDTTVMEWETLTSGTRAMIVDQACKVIEAWLKMGVGCEKHEHEHQE